MSPTCADQPPYMAEGGPLHLDNSSDFGINWYNYGEAVNAC